jgi:hypothetical protein
LLEMNWHDGSCPSTHPFGLAPFMNTH